MYLNYQNLRSTFFKIALLFSLIIFCQGQVFSQNEVRKMISKEALSLKKINTLNPFSLSSNRLAKTDIAIAGKKEIFNLDPVFNKKAIQAQNELLKINIPRADLSPLTLQLKKVDIFTDNFIFNTSSNKNKRVDYDKGLFYWGVVEGYENSVVAINIFNDEISGTIDLGEETLTLGKVRNASQHILYMEKDLVDKTRPTCNTSDIDHDLHQQAENQVRQNPNPDNCIRMYIEIDYDLYSHFGSTAATYNYITGAFSQVVLLYANESINMTINQLLIWDTQDPYTGTSTSDFLNQFSGAVGDGYNGDLAHLIGISGGGGIAQLSVVCSNRTGTGYSGINTSYNDVPAYSWTIGVLAHELGHNLGSPHTHNCSWNGNDTQIDDCGNTYLDSPPACFDANNPIIPDKGTIMSYCHLSSGNGIDLNLGFGPQPGDLIRSEVYNGACLSACQECTEQGNPCDDGNPCTIGDAIDSYCNCTGAVTPDSDQDGFCGENDPDDSDPCVPTPCTNCTLTTISITVDQYPGETSWDIVDANGVIVFSGGGYSGSPATQIRQVCIPDGCYDFVFKDQYGDGICCGYGEGSYTVTDNQNNTIASGNGNNSSSETTNFCYDNTTGGCTAGTACNDNNPCTTNDVLDANCNCVGTFADADNDGVCDASDVCPNGDDTVDSDGDGVPDACDNCSDSGTACNDNNPCTINDVIDVNCNCVGTFADADNDGVCDADDVCPSGDDSLDADGDGLPDACDNCDNDLVNTACDDGDICTINDIFDANCDCVGTFQDSDGDGICDAEDTIDCATLTTTFSAATLTHSGADFSTIDLTFTEMVENVSFTLSDLDQKINGNATGRFIDEVTITYINGAGNTIIEGVYSGADATETTITISDFVQSLTVALGNAYQGNTNTSSNATQSINLGTVSYCIVDYTCHVPSNVTHLNISGNVVKLSWDQMSNIKKYRIQYRVLGTYSWIEVISRYNNRFLNDLSTNTTYEYRIKTVCTSLSSVWSDIYSFQTANDLCDRPTNSTQSNITESSAVINWSADPTASKYKIDYSLVGSNWTTLYTNNPYVTLSALNSNLEYQYRLKAKCANGWTNWSEKFTFLTLGAISFEKREVLVTDQGELFKLSPNPASDLINITSNEESFKLMLVNSSGMILRYMMDNSFNAHLNVSELQTGIYFIIVTNSNGETQTKKFLKN